MLAWQILESELAMLFSKLSKIPPAMAMQIFYSARSFNGRMDLFKAALAASEASADAKTLARVLIRKAKKYSEYRNKFAHDQPLVHQFGVPPKLEIVMVDGAAQFQIDEVKQRYVDNAVRIADIRAAAECFRKLGNLARDFWAQGKIQSGSLDKLRERLHALPNLPPAEALSPPNEEP